VGAAVKRVSLLALVIAATAHAETRPHYGGTVVASLTSAPTSMDPITAQSYAEVLFTTLVFDTLYRLDSQGTATPHLAAGAPVLAADGKEARIEISSGIRWHSGKALTAADVVDSLQRAASAPSTEWLLAPVASIARDGDTVVLKLHRATPELATLLAAPQLSITPGGKAPGKTPVGSGPFQVSKLGVRRAELSAATAHFAGRPFVDALTLRWFDDGEDEARAYEAGDADVSLHGAVAFAGHQPKHPSASVDGPATILVFIGFGKAHTVAASVEFRRAVSYAMNRSSFKLVGAGERVLPALLPEAPDLGGGSPTTSEAGARIDEASAALKKALGGKEAPSLELILDKTRPDDAEVATRIVGALDRLGVSVTYTSLEPKEFARRTDAGACDLYVGQLVAPTTEPAHEYAAAFAAGGDRWPVDHMKAGDLTVSTAQVAFAERLPVVPLYHRAVRAQHKKVLRGLAFDSIGRLGYADGHIFSPPAATAAAPEEQP
jgi:MarR-like DNA-binding transcriptional regulator SgrR of sgrS sRNA